MSLASGDRPNPRIPRARRTIKNPSVRPTMPSSVPHITAVQRPNPELAPFRQTRHADRIATDRMDPI